MPEIFTIKVCIFGRRFLKTRAGAKMPVTSRPFSFNSRALVRTALRSKNQNYKFFFGKYGDKKYLWFMSIADFDLYDTVLHADI